MKHLCHILAAMVAAWTGSGCASLVPLAPVELDIGSTQAKVDYSGLDAVLAACVTEDGKLITHALRNQSGQLDTQLKLLAVTGPTVSPQLVSTPEQKLAYWYNARAGWAMKLALLANFKLTRPLVDHMVRKFPLDGRQMSINQIDQLLAQWDDFRVLAASPGVTDQSARLPERAFGKGDIQQRMQSRFEALIDDPRRVVIDFDRQEIRYPIRLWAMRGRIIDRFEKTYQARNATLRTALLFSTNGSAHRRLQDAVGYADMPRDKAFQLIDLIDY